MRLVRIERGAWLLLYKTLSEQRAIRKGGEGSRGARRTATFHLGIPRYPHIVVSAPFVLHNPNVAPSSHAEGVPKPGKLLVEKDDYELAVLHVLLLT